MKPDSKDVVVGPRDDLMKDEVVVGEQNWLGRVPSSGDVLEAQVRYRAPTVEARVEEVGELLRLRLVEPRPAVTPGQSAVLYPLQVWEEVERKLAGVPSSDRAKQRFLERVNYFGQQLKLDGQGRVVVPQILRDRAGMVGEVVVSGRIEHLEIWNRERFDQRLQEEPFTEEDFQALAELGV